MAGDPSYVRALSAALSRQDELREDPSNITFTQGTPRGGTSNQFNDVGPRSTFSDDVKRHLPHFLEQKGLLEAFGDYERDIVA